MRYLEAGLPKWNLVTWVLQSAHLDAMRAEGRCPRLSPDEARGRLKVNRIVASFAYARCMILVALAAIPAAPLLVSAHMLAVRSGRVPLMATGFALLALPAATQLAIFVWFSAQGGRYKQRTLITSARSLRHAGAFASLLAALSGIAFGLLTYRS